MLQKYEKRNIPLAWGLLHGINDWISGYIITVYSLHHSIEQSSLALIIYTILGFGGQLPAGMWLDKHKSLNLFIKLSIGLLVSAICSFWIDNWAAIILAGFSSAFIHITGGRICLDAGKGKAGPLGIFTGPGVLGLTLGIASVNLSKWWMLLALVAIFLILFVFKYMQNTEIKDRLTTPVIEPAHKLIEGHDWLMIGILVTVTLRSLLYEIISLLVNDVQNGLLVIGISAFAGKIIGGFLADRIGWKLWIYISLPLAFLLLQFGKGNLVMLGFGIACLQSSVPISLLLMQRAIPEFPATSVAMTLGVAVAVAALSFFIVERLKIQQGWFSLPGIVTGIVIITVILLYFIRARKISSQKLNY